MLEFITNLTPMIVPFIIGLVLGLVAKSALKVFVGLFALLILMSWAGYQVPSISNLISKVADFPQLVGMGRSWINILPFTAPPFCIGLVIGVYYG